MEQESLARINELAKKAKTVGLTAEEEAERKVLRESYIKTFRESLRGQLDNTVIVRPDGTRENLKKK